MTVDELHDVLASRLDDLEANRTERHGEIVHRLDSINGKVSGHDREITGLKIRDAYWAGGVAGVLALVKLLWK